MPDPSDIEDLLLRDHPGAEVDVRDTTGTGDHFEISIVSSRFRGLGRVAQHRVVYETLGPLIADGSVHAASMKTRAPDEP